jgi:hypothetical protein
LAPDSYCVVLKRKISLPGLYKDVVEIKLNAHLTPRQFLKSDRVTLQFMGTPNTGSWLTKIKIEFFFLKLG